ncbi:DUF6624 domain-containing protein [Chryseolinea sp. H1M3-3]|uniref:DUF6624 domain-containing protein n=1 Tax=Chryseolinea sp. H1M3-3 TaxID=3034144 RepID=UPI0023EB5E5D|nr:DUF6624 domain-containing protein [Chryseolinea sp. H1M3-3]
MQQCILVSWCFFISHLSLAQIPTIDDNPDGYAYNKSLAEQLQNIHIEDQQYRKKIEETENNFGRNSNEMKDLWNAISRKDSINTIKVTRILDEHGWLGPEVVGDQGNTTLFLVIQHANLKTQEKYLPMMREAVKNKKALGKQLALLEDRVALRQGRKQIYGSQVYRNDLTGSFYLAPIEDEPNVNKRRAAVGLEPLEIYAKMHNIDYKLPEK